MKIKVPFSCVRIPFRSARSPRGRVVWELSCSLGFVPIAGDFSTALEMTSCSLGLRRGEGAPPYRNRIRHFKQLLAHGGSPSGRRGTPLPNNVYSPHSSLGSLCSHSCHLPARNIVASPLWLKTVTCGLFLRCFAPPRRAPSWEGISGCLFLMSFRPKR